jgi:hypothetical protein
MARRFARRIARIELGVGGLTRIGVEAHVRHAIAARVHLDHHQRLGLARPQLALAARELRVQQDQRQPVSARGENCLRIAHPSHLEERAHELECGLPVELELHQGSAIAVAELGGEQRGDGAPVAAHPGAAEPIDCGGRRGLDQPSRRRRCGELFEARERLRALIAVELLPVRHAAVRSKTPQHDRPAAGSDRRLR